MKHIKIWFSILILLCGIGSFSFFYLAYPYHLEHREQMLLFTYTWEQFSSYWNHPAALACLLGDFFTQFLHLRTIGPLIVALTLMELGTMAFLTLRKWTNGWIAVILSVLLFAWEGMRLCEPHYPLASTAALIGGLFLFLCVAQFKNRWLFLIGGFVSVLLGYYFFGYGMYIFTICFMIETLMRHTSYKKAIRQTVQIHNTDNSTTCSCMQESIASSIGGIILPIISVLLPAVSANSFLMMPAEAYCYPATNWYSEPNFSDERTLGLNAEYYHDNWNKILELVYQGTPSNDISMCYNLANAMQGKLADRLMNYYQPAGLALFMPINEQSTYLSTQLASEVWFRLGDMTMAEHAAILSMIFSPSHKNVRMVKRMAEINLINGENEAAQKYLHILSKTLFYRDWAKERMPGMESEQIKRWIAEKRKDLPQKDTLRLSCTEIGISLHNLLEANPNNKMARDYLLCFDLLMKDLPSFIADYQKYYKEKPNRLFAEALMIHLFNKRAKGDEVKETGIHPSVIQDFNQFNHMYKQAKGNWSALQSRFSRTYWFYYRFATFD